MTDPQDRTPEVVQERGFDEATARREIAEVTEDYDLASLALGLISKAKTFEAVKTISAMYEVARRDRLV